MEKLILFTPGPVPVENHIRAIGRKQPPYNRTKDFSGFTWEILSGLRYVFQTEGSVALLTASGTGGMEASVLNFLCITDKALIVNGGIFGQRWCDLCEIHSIPYDEYKVPLGADLDLAQLEDLLKGNSYTALLVNAHETSTGHLFDIKAMGIVARRQGALFIVDAISTICADRFPMDDWLVDVAILSSQKALALPPGLAFVAMNQRAKGRLGKSPPKTLYFNLKNYLADQERGQLPFTPAIGLMLQLHQRLRDIQERTLQSLIRIHAQRAATFRSALKGLPFELLPARSSNAMTALLCSELDASEVVEDLRNRHNIVVTPNGGSLRTKVFRVSHMGNQLDSDLQTLILALNDVAHSRTHSQQQGIKI